MKILIDTHIALWALMDDPKMLKAAKQILMDENNDIYCGRIKADSNDSFLVVTMCFYTLITGSKFRMFLRFD